MTIEEICRGVAEGLPGSSVLPGGGVQYRRRGFPARIEFPLARTDFLFDIGDRMDASIQVAPAGLWHDVKALFGVHDFRIGAEAFDRDFEVRTSRDGFAERILSGEIQALLRSAALEGRMFWRVSRAGFLLRIPRQPGTRADLERWLSVALQLLDALPGLEEEVRMDAVEVAVAPDTTCQVCGGSLAEGAVVKCAKCATPHHRDCWVFNGRCSTFACGWLGYR